MLCKGTLEKLISFLTTYLQNLSINYNTKNGYNETKEDSVEKPPFRHRNIPYHCVRRWYSLYDLRIGASRREFLDRRDAVRRGIWRARSLHFRYKVRIMKDRALYEAWITGPPIIFNLEWPDIKLIEPIIDRIAPGRIVDDLAIFDLETHNPEDSVDNISALAIHEFYFGRRLNKAETNSVPNCPLVFDTGASTGLSPFKSDFLDDYKKYQIGVKEIAGGGSIVDGGTI